MGKGRGVWGGSEDTLWEERWQMFQEIWPSDLSPVTSAPWVYKMGMIIRAAPPFLRIKEQHVPGSL